ncbi:latent-transforming growth factor beta-binding protein 1-like [Macrosteles quadrilineatus]|uniref:latent-transforming growth factor beta-binding protein 1-like n=1 Tax=Macrosteles quadrilineatus TaxID=74068 RepID=UPI0023E17F69|nr:latent-transforming growth factor beta-binding protein 1-like [Macrosteles quadrilineatus]
MADYAETVRWLSGQEYARNHQLNQSTPSARQLRTGLNGRPLFSWDLPDNPETTTETKLQSQVTNIAIKTTPSTLRSDHIGIKDGNKKPHRTVWWPWRSYKDWSRSRKQNVKQFLKKDDSKTSNRHQPDFITDLRRKHEKTNKNKIHKNKHKSHIHKNRVEISKYKISKRKRKEYKLEICTKPKHIGTDPSGHKKSVRLKQTSAKEFLNENDNEIKIMNSNISIKECKEGQERKIKPANDSYSLNIGQFRQSFAFMKKKLLSQDYLSQFVNTTCDALCINFLGSMICKCPRGFQLDSTKRTCLDINECSSRNGHGPCQSECTNTRGSYHCSCTNLTGTRLADDRHSCEDIDECSATNIHCSHGCINTVGTAFCFCPDGYNLGADWQTCQDVDECVDLEIKKCPGVCINTVGSYMCV